MVTPAAGMMSSQPSPVKTAESKNSPLRICISEKDSSMGDYVPSPTVKDIDQGVQPNWRIGHHRMMADTGPDLEISRDMLLKLSKGFKAETEVVHIKYESKRVKIPAKSLPIQFTLKIPTLEEFDEPIKTPIDPGTLTQFGEKILSNETTVPSTKKGQQRKFCYRNAVSASGVPASFYDWAKLCKEESNEDSYDQVDMSHISPSAEMVLSFKNMTPLTPLIPDLLVLNDDKIYDAYLFATDDDYLSNATVRKLFFENALDKDDCKLFEMKEYVDEGTFPVPRPIDHGPVCSLM
jgi:hypothetical protein